MRHDDEDDDACFSAFILPLHCIDIAGDGHTNWEVPETDAHFAFLWRLVPVCSTSLSSVVQMNLDRSSRGLWYGSLGRSAAQVRTSVEM